MSEYISKATPTVIRANSRCTVKIKDNFYSIEYTEERSLPDINEVPYDIDKERQLLWQEVNEVVDDQIDDILQPYKKNS